MSGRRDKGELGGEILYSTCWEDLRLAREALRVPYGGQVLAIAAAGDNAIGLLLDDPARVVAVDVNPAQTALTELKLAALRELGDRAAAFVGAQPNAHRLADFARLRAHLSGPAAEFWAARTRLIERGVIHAGRFERHVAAARRLILAVAPGRAVVRELLAARSLEEQQSIYRRRWNSRQWRLLFRLAFNRRVLAALGRHPAFFTRAPRMDVAGHFLSRVEFGLTATPIGQNPYMTFALTGAYALPDATPDYLQPANSATLAARADRIEVRAAPIDAVLRSMPTESIDAFYLSDIFELADPPAFAATLGEIARVGRPGARLCYWNNLVDRSCPAELADRLAPMPGLASDLALHDRAFLYSRLVVETVRAAQAGPVDVA